MCSVCKSWLNECDCIIYTITNVVRDDDFKRETMLTLTGPNGIVRCFMPHVDAINMKVGDELRTHSLIEDCNSKAL